MSKIINCLSSNCLCCFPFLKSQEGVQQNYVLFSSPCTENLEHNATKLSFPSMIETTPLLPAQLMPEISPKTVSIVEKSNSEKEEFFGKNDFEKSLEKKAPEIINEIYEKLNNSLEGWDKLCEETVKNHKLKMHLKSYLKENKNRVNIFRLEYLAPCSAKDFIHFHNSVEESRIMGAKNIDSLEAFIEYGPENCYKLMYSKYKKILTANSRDFVYLKYFCKIKKNGKVFWAEMSQSIEDDNHPPIPENIRGDIILSGQIVEDVNEGECLVKSWIEVDFKLSLPLFVTKNVSLLEMKGWIEKCEERLKEINKEK